MKRGLELLIWLISGHHQETTFQLIGRSVVLLVVIQVWFYTILKLSGMYY